MKQSQLFTKTIRENPKDEVSHNAQLLQRAGFIHKEMAGVYNLLPLGIRVMDKIREIIKEEMVSIDGQEINMSSLQRKDLWERTKRWEEDVLFTTNLQSDAELGLGWSHEEPITDMMTNHISSFRDLPKYVFQFQKKFRNELRSKSGIMRTREFEMKDLYSFCHDENEHNDYYERVRQAYVNIFKKVGLGDKTYYTFASGGAFSDFSHEFQTLSDAGEDIIYIDKKKGIAINEEVYTDEVIKKLELKKEDLVKEKSIEVGNIFTLGERFSVPLGLNYKTSEGESKSVFMGSYGIGLGRLMGTIAEIYADENGLVWPESVSPFKIHLVALFGRDEKINKEIREVCDDIYSKGDILYDDRDVSAGEKLKDADLIGITNRIIVSEKTLEKKSVEVKKRNEKDSKTITIKKLYDSKDSIIL